MKNLAIILALFAPIVAFANTEVPPDDVNVIEQTQSQVQKQEQNQTGGDANATGGNSSSEGGDISISNKRPHRNTPNPDAPTVYPTVPCFRGQSGSAVVPGFGLSVGRGKIDEGCVRRELIRLAPDTHKLYLFCREPSVTEAFGDFETCLEHNQPDDEGGDDENDRSIRPSTYDDTSLREEIEAALSDVRDDLRQTQAEAQESRQYAVTASRVDPLSEIRRKLADVEYVK